MAVMTLLSNQFNSYLLGIHNKSKYSSLCSKSDY